MAQPNLWKLLISSLECYCVLFSPSLHQVSFEDVLAEPDAAQSIDCVWKAAYKCFNLWLGLCYKISTVLCGEWIYEVDINVNKFEMFTFPSTRWRLRIRWRNRKLRTALTVCGHAHINVAVSGWHCAIESAHCRVVGVKSDWMSWHVRKSSTKELNVWRLAGPLLISEILISIKIVDTAKNVWPKTVIQRTRLDGVSPTGTFESLSID